MDNSHFRVLDDIAAAMTVSPQVSYPAGTQRVADALRAAGHSHMPVLLPESGRTAQEAADGLGIVLGQIAKSIIFRRKEDGATVLVVTAGDRRVDEKKVRALVGGIGRADADFVKANTGFTIGGVAPLAHATPPVTLLDQSLQRFEVIWAAAGHHHAVFQLTPADLARLCPQAQWADVDQPVAAPPSSGPTGADNGAAPALHQAG